MFESIKSIFHRSKAKSVYHNIIKINVNGSGLLSLIKECAISTFDVGHMFLRKYLLPLISPLNDYLKEQLDIYISSINEKRYSGGQLTQVLDKQINDKEGYISMVLQLWYPYMATEINNNYDSINFFRIELYLLVELLLRILRQIYQKQQLINPEQEGELQSRKFRIKLLQIITDSYEFEKIKTFFVKRCKLGCGVSGDFTPSQVELTTQQLNQLIRFKQIPAPFHQSIGLMLQFYAEYRITNKAKILVEAVNKAKQQIISYRNFFNMGNTVLGSDQIMPVINYICEKTNKNIFASIQYIRAILGGGRNYREQDCFQSLKMIDINADYCVNLVESMSSIYCHASRMG